MKVKCSHCQEFFPRDKVINYSKGRDGRKKYFYCRKCNTERMKRYYHTKKGSVVVKGAQKRNYQKFPERVSARSSVQEAVSNGKLKKPEKCSICGATNCRIEGHHNDYSKRLEVIWCCTDCHATLDKQLQQSMIA